MKITFEGSPAEILRDMREYVALAGGAARTPDSYSLDEIEREFKKVVQDNAKPATTANFAVDEEPRPSEEVVQPPKNEVPEISGGHVCRFCAKSLKNAKARAMHERYCGSNPDRQQTSMEKKWAALKSQKPTPNDYEPPPSDESDIDDEDFREIMDAAADSINGE